MSERESKPLLEWLKPLDTGQTLQVLTWLQQAQQRDYERRMLAGEPDPTHGLGVPNTIELSPEDNAAFLAHARTFPSFAEVEERIIQRLRRNGINVQ